MKFFGDLFTMFGRHKTLDFSAIDVRVGNDLICQRKSDLFKFRIPTVYIERIPDQLDALSSLNHLSPGDLIVLDTYFGWCHGDDWITIPLKGTFRIFEIIPEPEIREVRLRLKPIRLKFRIGSDNIT